MYKHLFLLLFCCSAFALKAQNLLLQQADHAMQELDYMSAILLYQQVLQEKNVADAQIGLAECYRLINDTENAERMYAEVVRLPNAKPKYRLYYGMMLQANGKCNEARAWFEQYAADNPDDARGQHLVRACDMADVLRAAGEGIYKVQKLPFNSPMDDFSPTIRGNQVIFASDRDPGGPVKRTNMWTGNPFTELYALDFKPKGQFPGDFAYGLAEKFAKGLNTKFNEAAATFSPDGRTIYFTRNNFLSGHTGRNDEGLIKLKIYAGNANATDTWENLQALGFCNDNYNTAHPALSPDGSRLYFASNMPGGYGGMDLYLCEWEGGRWGLPVNLGPVVNTEGNEVFPYADKSGRLYFASNGHIGLGGLDIYYSTPKGKGEWNEPVNPGAPLNSTHDDFGITFSANGSWGFFSSDREGGVGRDDVYGFHKSSVPLELMVTDTMTKAPVSDVSIRNVQTGQVMITGPDGRTSFDLRPAECATFVTEKKKYDANKRSFCAQAGTPAGARLEIPIERTADYSIQGIVFDMVDGLPADGARVLLINNCNEPIPDVYITGDDGRFRFPLGKNCCYTLKAIADGYITDVSDEQCTAGLPPEEVLRLNLSLQPYRDADGFVTAPSDNANPLPSFNKKSGKYENSDGSPASLDLGNGIIVKNGILFDNGEATKPIKTDWQRSAAGDGFLVNLYYDFNQASLRSESVPELQKLLKTLQDNSELTIEIAAHTDARGSAEYNLQLSQRRADAVVSWLVHNGIDASRLSPKGYGESQPVNDCGDDVPCPEEMHQLNRRTEFRITGTTTLLSKPKSNPKTAPCKGCPF